MALRARKLPVLRTLLMVKVILLTGFFALAAGCGPFPDANTPAALHLSALPPTTLMTGSTTQATLDAVDLLSGVEPAQRVTVRARFGRLALAILYFAAGCAGAALLYALVGFWCLAVPVIVGAVAAVMRIDA
jgi:uncharacterized membrane protein YoaK (UPF0700 family)